MKANWLFPESNTMHRTGIGESGIETFRGSPINSLVREICQNSLDAIKNETEPVRVEFKYFEILSEEFPDKENMLKVLNSCKSYSELTMMNKDTSKFFERAIKTLSSSKIPMMRISDFNTRGLTGSHNVHDVNPWTSLIYSDGISDKDNGSGGSYGIGKNAIFVCSNLRTIFYSTLDYENNEAHQGVSKLISHRNKNNKYSESIGYYGNDQIPVYQLLNLDKNYVRKESGTDIYIAAFDDSSDWKAQIIISAFEDYLLSIYHNKLIINVNGEEINKDTLEDMINRYSDKLKYAKDYYDVLTDVNTHTTDIKIDNIGIATLKVLYGKNYKRKILMSRGNGMKIYDQDRISGSVYFAGVLIMEDENVNEFFRVMENPQHNAWEPSRTGVKSKLYDNVLRQLKRDIKQFIIETGQSTISDEVDAEGVGEFLPDLSQQDNTTSNKQEEESLNFKINKIELNKVKTENNSDNMAVEGNDDKISSELLGEYEDDGEYEGFSNGNGSHSGNRPPGVSYKKDDEGSSTLLSSAKFIKLKSVRIMMINPIEKIYKMLLTLNDPIEKGFVEINLSGEQGSEKAKIENPTIKGILLNKKLKFKNNKILLDNISANKKNVIEFKLNYPISCSLEAKVYGY